MHIYLLIICLIFTVGASANTSPHEWQEIDKVGKWETRSQVNPFDDSKTVATRLYADSGKSPRGYPIGLYIRCESNMTEMYIVWNADLGSKEYISVLTRIGSNKPELEDWGLSMNNEATFFYPLSPISYLKKMMKSNKFVAQVTPYKENPITAVFDTTGMKRALKHIREECGW